MIGEIVSQGREQMELTISGPIYGDNQPMVEERNAKKSYRGKENTERVTRKQGGHRS